MASDYFPTHAHSEWSPLDGMGLVEDMAKKVAGMGQPALALTDHGSMAGVIRLYKECKKNDLAAFPGSELYIVSDVTDKDAKEKRFHLGMLSLNLDGYKAMVKLSSRSYQRDRFHRKPLVDFQDLADIGAYAGNDIAVTTGCYFGLVIQTLVNQGSAQADAVIRTLRSWFPNLYVEVQHHGIGRQNVNYTEDQINDWLFSAAQDHGLPTILGQDSHYCDAGHQKVHDLMKRISYFGDGDDNIFPGGPYDLATVRDLKKHWSKDQWAEIEAGHSDLLDKHALIIPALEKYKFYVPKVAKNPNKILWNRCVAAMAEKNITKQEYVIRLGIELNVISEMKMADYFILVQEIVQWCHDNNVIVNSRGSVNGSLVCYLLGITTIDPILWGTSFARFLSIERKKPPDIDLDVESSNRHLVIEHIRKKFPSMVGIGTYTRLGITEQDDGSGNFEDKGSVFVQYMAAMRRKQGKSFTGQVDPKDRAALNLLADMKVRKSLGAHAAGLVLATDEHKIEDYLATGLIPSSGTVVTQSVMEDVEDCGFMKLDLLGLAALGTINGALLAIGKTSSDWSWLPWDDKVACGILSSGHCEGIFQFEGWTTAKGGREMKIRNTMDAVICLALYRPAMMAGGQKDRYLINRTQKKGQRAYALHSFFDDILDVTSGVPVFQEQVMEMCLKVGMDFETWNELMKAIKASNDKIGQYAVDTMIKVEPIFYKLCKKQQIRLTDAKEAWHAIVGFTDYGFNRAHATSYGVMAYRSAYLKALYPMEYMNALLNTWVGTTKEPQYIAEARRMGFKIGRPDVNISGIDWKVDPKRPDVLRKGLQTIKGVGLKAAATIVTERPVGGFRDMDHFVDVMPARPVTGGKSWKKDGSLNGVCAILRDAGALASIWSDQ